MKQYQRVCQHIGVLSLSMLLTSYLTVFGTLPYLIEEFPDRSRASVEMLISVPSIPALIMLIITPFITRKLSESQLITIATTAVGIGGILPMFVSQFETIFAARILLGAGIGLMDARSVSMVGERYAGAFGSDHARHTCFDGDAGIDVVDVRGWPASGFWMACLFCRLSCRIRHSGLVPCIREAFGCGGCSRSGDQGTRCILTTSATNRRLSRNGRSWMASVHRRSAVGGYVLLGQHIEFPTHSHIGCRFRFRFVHRRQHRVELLRVRWFSGRNLIRRSFSTAETLTYGGLRSYDCDRHDGHRFDRQHSSGRRRVDACRFFHVERFRACFQRSFTAIP